MSEPKLLILETSGQVGQVALAQGDRLLGMRRLDRARRHARDLVPAVGELLEEQAWRPADIAAVLVSRGPGSYTGLRVGIMSAKAFAYATGCTVLGIETFAAIALQVLSDHQSAFSDQQVDVIADAQQDKVYVQRFQVSAGGLPEAVSPLRILSLSDWLAQADRPTAGPGVEAFRERLPATLTLSPEETWNPRPESLLKLGIGRLAHGAKDDLWTLEPLYLRPSSAEELWDARAKGSV